MTRRSRTLENLRYQPDDPRAVVEGFRRIGMEVLRTTRHVINQENDPMRRPRPRPYTANYPGSATEVIDPNAKFKAAALQAVHEFRRSKPWRGTGKERRDKFRTLNRALARAYRMAPPRLVFAGNADGGPGASGSSTYSPSNHTITLRGRLSVVTFLHEFGHARGYDELDACYWSINLFRRCFPRSFARCRFDGHMLVRDR